VKPGKVFIPAMVDSGAQMLAAAFRAVGIEAENTPPSDGRTLELGARHTCGDECFPAKITIGDFFRVLERPETDPAKTIFFMPLADGPCRFGQYAPYLRSILDANGYRQVRIFSPNCDDGYDTLGAMARPLVRTAWRVAVMADILEKLRLMTRPYEANPGDTDAAFRECLAQSCRTVEAAPVRPGAQLRAFRSLLTVCRDRFREVKLRPDRHKPLIGIVGEIFCRLNPFSNQDLVRRLEELGAEAWIAGFGEWVWYTNAEEFRLLGLRRQLVSRRGLAAYIRRKVQRRDEEVLLAPFASEFAGRHDPPIEEVLRAAQPYLPPRGAIGEMVLNVGNLPCMARRGVDGVIDISPFTCMNGIVSEAIYPRVSADLGGLPVRSLYFDGTVTDLDSELVIFLEMACAYRRRRLSRLTGTALSLS